MERYILKYIQDNSSSEDIKRILDYLKSEIDSRLWSQGRHSTYSWDLIRLRDIAVNDKPKWKNLYHQCRQWIRVLKSPFNSHETSKQPLVLSSTGYNVLSVVNVPKESIQALQRCGINYYYLGIYNGTVAYDMPAANSFANYYKTMQNFTFSQLISRDNIETIERLYKELEKELSSFAFDAVLVRTSELFFEKILIDIFKSFHKPSITLLHGLPGIYTQATESRAEYLSVWGATIRDAFVNAGYDPDKVIVAGNYKYASIPKVEKLRCDTEDVLVLTTETYADGQHEWEYDKFPIHDRSLLITFIYSVEHVLKQNGVSHARLRPHPHVNKDWLKEYIDQDFYTLDYDNMLSSLQHATMCIGPTSSTMIESLMSGVSYLAYEPGDGKHTCTGSLLVPPFDGTYSQFRKAYSEEELSELIKECYISDANKLLNDFLQPFNPQVIKHILDEQKA